jgi:uncharacterized membrane protein YuzA (DUF378 family)
MELNIYYLLAGLAVVYLAFSIYNKRGTKKRRSRKFMEDYRRKDMPDKDSE